MAWIAAIIGGVVSAGSAAKQKSAAKKAATAAGAAGAAGYDRAAAGLAPYNDLGLSAASKLGRLTGTSGYRTDAEEAYTQHMANKPTLESISMPDKYKVKPFSKEAGEVGTLQSIDTGMALRYYGKKNKAAKMARAVAAQEQAEAQRRYEQEVADWEAQGQQLKVAADQSLENYDPMAYLKSVPGYEARYGQGAQMVENQQAGRALGGRAVKELQKYGQDYASAEYQKEYDRLLQMTQLGANTAAQTGSYNVGAGNALADMFTNRGQADVQYASNINDTVQQGLKNYRTQTGTDGYQSSISPTYSVNQGGQTFQGSGTPYTGTRLAEYFRG